MLVETEFGKLEAKTISSEEARKEYLCPLCEGIIEIGEAHNFITPELYGYRRHLHTECVNEFVTRNLTIKLHPNSSA